MRPFFHADAYATDRVVPSWWEETAGPPPAGCPPLAGEERADVAVIGGGYTGLSAALHLARDHGVDVCVLEAGPPGWGASGRNGGFCCIGGAKLGMAAMIRRFGLDEVRRFYASQKEGIALVRSLAGEEGIDLEPQGEGMIEVAHRPSRLASLKEEAAFSTKELGLPAAYWSRQELAERGFAGPQAHGGLHHAHGFGLHPLKYHRGLTRAALARGVRLHAGSRVLAWERTGREHRLVTAGGSLTAARVIVATNGYTPDDLHPALAGAFLPAISNIVVTRPLTPAELEGQGWRTDTPAWDTRNLLFYFRLLPDRRLLFGARGDTVGSPAAAARMRGWLERRLGQMFPAFAGAQTTHFWNGLVCLSASLTPMVGQMEDDPGVWYGLAYHGNGVSTATWAGRAIARAIAGRNDASGSGLPAVVAGKPVRFPLPALRKWYLRGAYLAYRVKDAL